MAKYEGSHGTSETNAINIKKEGFRLDIGRVGTAVYFWVKNQYYIELARSWYEFSVAKKRIIEDNPKCAILLCELEAEEKEVLDLENSDLRSKVLDLALERNIDFRNYNKIAKLFDLFISKLENTLNVKYKIVLAEVGMPPIDYCNYYPISILGMPLGYAVRDVNCIEIKEIIN